MKNLMSFFSENIDDDVENCGSDTALITGKGPVQLRYVLKLKFYALNLAKLV